MPQTKWNSDEMGSENIMIIKYLKLLKWNSNGKQEENIFSVLMENSVFVLF